MSEAITLKDSGNSKFKAGDFDGAVADWQAAIKSNAGDNAFKCTCSSNIAMAYAKKSDWQNVFKFASSAIDCDDQHVKSFFRRGVALRHMGRTDEAKSDLQRALQLEDNPGVRKELSLCRDPTAKTGSVFANLGAALGKASLYDDKPSNPAPAPSPVPHEKQHSCSLHIQPLSATMSSTESRQLQPRLDVRAETSSFAASLLLLWAFQSSEKQLQAIFDPRSSLALLCVSAAQSRAFGSHVGAKQRQSLLTCSRLCVTLAARLMCFRNECAVTHPLKQAACILSRRHILPVLRLGAVAAAGAGSVRFIGSRCWHPQCGYGGVAFDGEGNLVVCDSGKHCIEVFRYSDGTHLRSFGSQGAGNGQFNWPWGIAFDGAGHIIVSENNNHRVQVLRYSDGAHVRTISSKGTGNVLLCPRGIAVDGEGNIAVFDCFKARVQVRRLSDGACIRSIGSEGSDNGQFGKSNGQFETGHGGVAFDSEGNLVVADYSNHRVQVLRYSDGAHIRNIGREGTGAGFFAGQFQHPTGVAFDAAGHIVVVDAADTRVQVLRYSDGAHVRTIDTKGSGGKISVPQGGIAIDSDGRIVMADNNTHLVQVLE